MRATLPDLEPHVDPDWDRPIRAQYLDPVEVVWLTAAHRLGFRVGRDATIFSRTEGDDRIWLGPRHDLDADDTLAQMLLHELAHWITNGEDSRHARDWGFPLDDLSDPREFAALRLQATLADAVGLRRFFGPTGTFRQYYDRLGPDPLAPLDEGPHEARIVALATRAVARAALPPFAPHLQDALRATAAVRAVILPFLPDHAPELGAPDLPSLWTADPPKPAQR